MSSRPTGEIALAALLFAALPASSSPIDVQAIAGLPRVTFATAGAAVAWHSVGMRAESTWLDVEMRAPTCLSSSVGASEAGTAAPPACGDGRFRSSHDVAITFKLPRSSGDPFLVDLSLRQWRATLVDSSERVIHTGSAAALTLSRSLAGADIDMGIELPTTQGDDGRARWRTAFAGASWSTSYGVGLEIAIERSVDLATGAVDRSATLRLARPFRGTDGRIAFWATRSFDAPSIPWRATLAIDVSF